MSPPGIKPGRFGFAQFLISLELALIYFFCLRPATDPDYGWHVANGWHVLDGATLGGRDIYSWTATNLWIAHEWLTEAVMGLVHRAFGPSGNSILAAALGCAAYALVVIVLRQRQTPRSAIVVALPIIFVGAMRSVGVRPLMLELFYVALLVTAIDRFLSGRIKRKTSLIIVLAGGVIWANTHGSFLLLPAVLAITAAELVVANDKRWRDLAVAALIAGVVPVVNPWGVHIFEFATQSVSSAPTLAYIDEWKRPRLDEPLAIPLLLQVVLAVMGAVAILRKRKHENVGRDLPYTIGLLRAAAFAYLAFTSGRHVMLFGIGAAPLIARAIQPVTDLLRRRLSRRDLATYDPRRDVINVVAAAILILAIARVSWLTVAPEAQRTAIAKRYPMTILPMLERGITRNDRLFNEYSWGGFLIERGILPVFIDGRSELYGDRQLERYASIIHLQTGWERRLDSLGITKVLMPVRAPLTSALLTRQWRVVARDSVGVLLERGE